MGGWIFQACAMPPMAKPAEVVAISTLVGGKLHKVRVKVFELATHTLHAIIIRAICNLARLALPVFSTFTTKLIVTLYGSLLAAYTLGTKKFTSH